MRTTLETSWQISISDIHLPLSHLCTEAALRASSAGNSLLNHINTKCVCVQVEVMRKREKNVFFAIVLAITYKPSYFLIDHMLFSICQILLVTIPDVLWQLTWVLSLMLATGHAVVWLHIEQAETIEKGCYSSRNTSTAALCIANDSILCFQWDNIPTFNVVWLICHVEVWLCDFAVCPMVGAPMLPPEEEHLVTASDTVNLPAPTLPACLGHWLCGAKHTQTHTIDFCVVRDYAHKHIIDFFLVKSGLFSSQCV